MECALSAAPPPADADGADPRRIDAGFLRALLLADEAEQRIHESGLRISGAFVTGRLNLAGCRLKRAVSLTQCRFEHPIVLTRADTLSITLDGSITPGVYADRARIRGSLYLRALDAKRPFTATDSVSCVGALIDSDLGCRGGIFSYAGALAKDVSALIGARRERLDEYESALSVHNARIGGTLDLRDAVVRDGAVDLALGQVNTLRAHREDVERGFREVRRGARPELLLDGFIYEHIPIGLAGDPEMLERLLLLQPPEHLGVARRRDFQAVGLDRAKSRRLYRIQNRFRPQPFEEAVRVLRAMGYEENARRIALFKQRRRRRARGEFSPPGRAVHWAFGFTAGYGYRPRRALTLLLALWLAGGLLAMESWRRGGIAPSDPQVLLEAAWAEARREAEVERSAGLDWDAAQGVAPPNVRFAAATPNYPRFEALAYSADVMAPFIDLGQERAWGPDASTPIGAALHYWRFAHASLGLILSALLIASVTAVVQRF